MNEQMGTNKYRYCLHCMTPVTQASGACSHCGHEVNGVQIFGGLKPGTLLNYQHYLVGDAIGQGGFGITYLGYDLALGIPVAIKEYYPNGNASRDNNTSAVYSAGIKDKNEDYQAGKAKFIREAQTLAKFSGTPGIVDVKNVFQENNTA